MLAFLATVETKPKPKTRLGTSLPCRNQWCTTKAKVIHFIIKNLFKPSFDFKKRIETLISRNFFLLSTNQKYKVHELKRISHEIGSSFTASARQSTAPRRSYPGVDTLVHGLCRVSLNEIQKQCKFSLFDCVSGKSRPTVVVDRWQMDFLEGITGTFRVTLGPAHLLHLEDGQRHYVRLRKILVLENRL